MRIVCVHQGYELYGSDRAFVESVEIMREAWPEAEIEVVLPREGPIVPPLRRLASRISFEPLWVLRRKDVARLLTVGLIQLVPALLRAFRRFRSADLVYVNTVVVVDYLIMARYFSAKTLVHVHEIPEGAALRLFRALLAWSRSRLILNSRATQAAYRFGAQHPQHVVYSAVAIAPPVVAPRYDGQRRLRALMLGRISRIKGQDLLIDAIAALPQEISSRLDVRIVGGAFASDLSREEQLRVRVKMAGLSSVVSFEPFQEDPTLLYDWADIVLVPSRLPESLGRVAIEAMAFARPPLAAAIGGLSEVVEDGVSGWLVPPNDAGALARRLAQIVTQPERWATFPAAARQRYESTFSHRVIAQQLQAIVRAQLEARGSEPDAAGLARAQVK